MSFKQVYTGQTRFQPTRTQDLNPPYCSPVLADAGVEGETPRFRNTKNLRSLRCTPQDGINTVIDIVHRAAERLPNGAALGSRRQIRTHTRLGAMDSKGNQQSLQVPELSGYDFISYDQYQSLIAIIGYALIQLGLMPRRDKICVWSQTR
jgi:long-chain acyl-CoA synthetase